MRNCVKFVCVYLFLAKIGSKFVWIACQLNIIWQAVIFSSRKFTMLLTTTWSTALLPNPTVEHLVIFHHSHSPNVHYRTVNSPHLNHIRNQLKPVNTTTSCLFFKYTLHHRHLGLTSSLLPSGYSTEVQDTFTLSPCTMYVPHSQVHDWITL